MPGSGAVVEHPGWLYRVVWANRSGLQYSQAFKRRESARAAAEERWCVGEPAVIEATPTSWGYVEGDPRTIVEEHAARSVAARERVEARA